MTETLTSKLACVSIDTLRKRVAETKSASTARYYTAMLNRLEEYNQSPLLDLASVSAEYISNFGEYLVKEGATLSTIKLFKMAFRAVMKEVYGSELRSQFRTVFKDVGSKNNTATNSISFDDLKKIANCNLENLVVLDRARNLFLYCVVSGGLSHQDVKRMVETATIDQRLPQQKLLIRRFKQISERGFENYVSKLDSKQYKEALVAIGISAGLSSPLTPECAVHSWITLALKANAPSKLIASMIPNGASFTEVISAADEVSEEEKLHILQAAANAFIDMKPRWFAMKCYNTDPRNIDKEIADAGILSIDESFSSFVPPEPEIPKSKPSAKKSVISNMYFFNCKLSTAVAIKKSIRDLGWVYTLSGSSTPAQISDTEMKTFMLLCDVSEGTLIYYFPNNNSEREEFAVGKTARIIDGNFSGHVGVIKELPDNKYKVIMTFSALSAKVIAEVPVDFIRLS